MQGKPAKLIVCAVLILAVLIAYGPVWHADFVAFDDNDYVTTNDPVQHGLSLAGFVWSFTTTHASLWHPLTWLSYMFDSQFFGAGPFGFHLTNILLHAANSVLLFLLIEGMTALFWPSVFVAIAFAVHPQHVESVAWISERKDVLSTFFWMLSVTAYARYARAPGRRAFYFLSLALFALGLMAKPMLITLPVILLLLDVWPLRRDRHAWPRWILEKVPFLILSIIMCVVTVLVAKHSPTVKGFNAVPLPVRLENVPVSVVRYLATAFWPVNLAVLYPYHFKWEIWQMAGSVALLLIITILVLRRLKAAPAMAIGWFWFLAMLAPVLGLVQVGPFSIADRYSYLSSTGLFLIVVWLARSWIAAPVCVVALMAGMALTWNQAGYWRNSESLFRHTLAVTDNNPIMESNLGKILIKDGRNDEAISHLLKAVSLQPDLPLAHYNLGSAYLAKGRVAEALEQFDLQLRIDPRDAVGQFRFGRVLFDNNLVADALPHLAAAVELSPEAADYRCLYAWTFLRSGRYAEAADQFEKSIQIMPQYVPGLAGLAWIRATAPAASLRNGAEAVRLATDAAKLSGNNPRDLGVLAAGLAECHDFPAAAEIAKKALAAAEDQPALAQALRSQLQLYQSGKPYRDSP